MIICDLDGVFADFVTAACNAHGVTDYAVDKWNFFRDWGIDTREFWRVIHETGDVFYNHMVQPYPWAWTLLDMLKNSPEDFILMSSPSDSPYGYSGKKLWVDKYLGADIPLIVGSAKQLLAKPGVLLIDDYPVNIREFNHAGGSTLVFPQRWNANKNEISCRMDFVASKLQAWEQRHHPINL